MHALSHLICKTTVCIQFWLIVTWHQAVLQYAATAVRPPAIVALPNQKVGVTDLTVTSDWTIPLRKLDRANKGHGSSAVRIQNNSWSECKNKQLHKLWKCMSVFSQDTSSTSRSHANDDANGMVSIAKNQRQIEIIHCKNDEHVQTFLCNTWNMLPWYMQNRRKFASMLFCNHHMQKHVCFA